MKRLLKFARQFEPFEPYLRPGFWLFLGSLLLSMPIDLFSHGFLVSTQFANKIYPASLILAIYAGLGTAGIIIAQELHQYRRRRPASRPSTARFVSQTMLFGTFMGLTCTWLSFMSLVSNSAQILHFGASSEPVQFEVSAISIHSVRDGFFGCGYRLSFTSPQINTTFPGSICIGSAEANSFVHTSFPTYVKVCGSESYYGYQLRLCG